MDLLSGMKSKRIVIVLSNSSVWDKLHFDNFGNNRQITGNLQKKEKITTYKGKRGINKRYIYK